MLENRKHEKAMAGNLETENLKKLKQSDILKNFVRINRGLWDHQAWLNLCEEIHGEGYHPIDLSEVGLHLEEVKAAYQSGKQE